MSKKEKQEMLDKLTAEGLSQDEAEAKITESTPVEDSAEDAVEDAVEGEKPTADNPVKNGREQEDEGDGQDDHSSDAEEEEQDTFPRAYVEKLRKEAAGYREKAKSTEGVEKRLHEALVRLDGRLADPSDLPFDAEHLADTDVLAEAITALLEKKPGLKAQKVGGDIGAGKRGGGKKPSMDLLSIMKGL